jgi:DNA invertase Pin-like site-specific DNA recombinase
MMGVFAKFERAMITDRIRAGVARVKTTGVTKSGKPTGRRARTRRRNKPSAASLPKVSGC